MIPDETLAAWEEMTKNPKNHCIYELADAIAEIRRLEAELFHVEDDKIKLNRDLAAHRAVIRELAEYLGDMTFSSKWVAQREAVLAHPLGVVAREEKV